MVSLLAIAGLTSTVNAQKTRIVISDKNGWHKIGRMVVDFQKERDVINIIGSNGFSAIKFQVQNAPIDLREIVIYYAGGDSQKVDINSTIKPEGYSRVIDLDGRERNLKKIAFVYKTVSNNNDKKARLQVWGLKADTDKK